MKAEVKKAWTQALRSGIYPQASGALRGPSGYCCWGVLCDILDNTKWSDTLYLNNCYGYKEGTEELYGIPNDSIYQKVGLLTYPSLPVGIVQNDPRYIAWANKVGVRLSYRIVTLETLNDIGFTFNEIADIIDKYW